MKVIFITREGYRLPGARIRCYHFAQELSQQGIETQVLSFSDTLGGKDGEEEREMDTLRRLYLNWRALRFIRENSLGSILFLQRIHYHALGPLIASFKYHLPLVVDMDDWEIKEDLKFWGPFSNSKGEMFWRLVIKRAQVILAASHFLKDFLSRYGKKVYYLPSAVDTEKFLPLSTRGRRRNFVFSWIGTLHRKDNMENIEFITRCFEKLRKRYPEILLEICGDGLYRKETEKILYRKKGVNFRGWISPQKIPQYLSQVDVGLLPLIQELKFNLAKSPVKLFEYMACGIPVVASKRGEVPHFIKDGVNGFLASSEEEFIKKMEILVCNPFLRKKMGKEARKTAVEKASLKKWGEKLKEILLAHFSH